MNGKRSGKGKKYYNSKLIFEGEYLDGKRHGKGKEYNSNGIFKVESKYISGKFFIPNITTFDNYNAFENI